MIIFELQKYTDYEKLVKEERYNSKFLKPEKRVVDAKLMRTVSLIGDIMCRQSKDEYSDIIKVLTGMRYTTCHTHFMIHA